MSGNTFGKIFRVTTWGESHGKAVGAVVDGCPPGLELCEKDIQKELDKRKPGQSKVSTQRKEDDLVEILSGVFEGKTTGTPICLVIKNKDQQSKDYSNIKDIFRPGHADHTFLSKYKIRDYRGGGRASGRETAGRVAAGAIAKKLLMQNNIQIIAHTIQIGKVYAQEFNETEIESNPVRCADKNKAVEMEQQITDAQLNKTSIGGAVEIIASGVPAGLGEPVFDKLDAEIAKALMSLGAVKAVEIGAGTSVAQHDGLHSNDSPFFDEQNEKIHYRTNNAGGILGGISNGEN
ncbi:MAG: chorismate synthase, partial [Candidatus Diapherotrites archaeon]|nr:chorismate synthase [Candidatus Diapherotrites archaeon]